MKMERVSITTTVELTGTRIPTGTPQTDDMRSMVSDLRSRGEASPLTYESSKRITLELQKMFDRELMRAIRGGVI